jgi:hypothetical protein
MNYESSKVLCATEETSMRLFTKYVLQSLDTKTGEIHTANLDYRPTGVETLDNNGLIAVDTEGHHCHSSYSGGYIQDAPVSSVIHATKDDCLRADSQYYVVEFPSLNVKESRYSQFNANYDYHTTKEQQNLLGDVVHGLKPTSALTSK